MTNTLYTQILHLLAIVALAVLVGLGKINQETGIALIVGLVGVAIPSPFVDKGNTT